MTFIFYGLFEDILNENILADFYSMLKMSSKFKKEQFTRVYKSDELVFSWRQSYVEK